MFEEFWRYQKKNIQHVFSTFFHKQKMRNSCLSSHLPPRCLLVTRKALKGDRDGIWRWEWWRHVDWWLMLQVWWSPCSIYLYIYMCVFPKIGVFTPQIMNFNRVFHELNHPFWRCSPYFWVNTRIFIYIYIHIYINIYIYITIDGMLDHRCLHLNLCLPHP